MKAYRTCIGRRSSIVDSTGRPSFSESGRSIYSEGDVFIRWFIPEVFRNSPDSDIGLGSSSSPGFSGRFFKIQTCSGLFQSFRRSLHPGANACHGIRQGFLSKDVPESLPPELKTVKEIGRIFSGNRDRRTSPALCAENPSVFPGSDLRLRPDRTAPGIAPEFWRETPATGDRRPG